MRTELGPDATSVGWVYQYALRDVSGRHDLSELRSLQDWFLRYHLESVPGVSEVAAVGGFVKQYQVDVDPSRLLAWNVPLSRVLDAVRRGSGDAGGRVIELAGTEYVVRSRGLVSSPRDIAKIVVGEDRASGRPILVEDVAEVAVGPEMRRGVADLDGEGDTVGGVVVMRHGENALAVIERVRAKLAELERSLPEGVEIVPVYDRAPLIRRSIATLLRALAEEMAIVSLVILVFLWHLPSAIVPIVTIPVSVLLAFLPLYALGVTVNIMSLSGIAISIGVLVDGAIVEVENAYKRLHEWAAGDRKADVHAVRLAALQEVGPTVFFSLLVIAVAFLPVLALVGEELRDEMDAHLRLPGIPNIWTMPIRNRIDMLATGVRTPIGVKVLGPDLRVVQEIGEQLERLLRRVPGTRSVVAERAAGGYYLDFVLDRDALARHGVSVADANAIVAAAIGGAAVTSTIEGRARYTVSVRYARDFRDSVRRLRNVLVPVASGGQVPLGELAQLSRVEGPSMIRNENGQLAGYVFVDLADRDPGAWVRDAQRLVADELRLPPGYSLVWSGQYESIERVRERLWTIVPATLLVIVLLLYLSTRSIVKVGIVLLAVPFSLVGAVWLLAALDYNVSVAVWVGMIALMGLDAETGVLMLLFLDLAWERRRREGRLRTPADLVEAVVEGAVKRVRPKMMTVVAAFLGLLPLMCSTGTGADMMKRVAAPMVGGLATSFALELLVYPAVYFLWRKRQLA